MAARDYGQRGRDEFEEERGVEVEKIEVMWTKAEIWILLVLPIFANIEKAYET